MSWSANLKEKTAKRDIETAIDILLPDHVIDDMAYDQLRAAKRAAKEIAKSVPGPFLSVILSGHANGVGWQKKEGWANDTISVTVTQMTE